MSEESIYLKDFRFLANIHRDPSSIEVKNDLGMTRQELQDQYEQAEELDASWTYRPLFTTMCSDANAGEFALFNIRFLKTAITTKDNIIRLTQRFVLLDAIYSTLCQYERISQQALEKWKEERTAKSVEMENVIMTTDKTVRKVESIIAEIEAEINETMNSLPEGKCRLQKQLFEDANVSLEHPNSCVKEMKGTKTVEGEDEPHVHDMETEYRKNANRKNTKKTQTHKNFPMKIIYFG
nr:unnamed protein product [Haemonchus contortus]